MDNNGIVAFLKDIHLMFGFRNLIRKPGWENDITLKLETVKNLMLEKNCRVLLLSGDILDRSKSKEWSFKLYLKVLSILQHIFVDNGINIYSIQGNHDMFDGAETLEDCVFGKLVEDGIINHITSYPLELLFQGDDGSHKRAIIYGLDYTNVRENTIDLMQQVNDVGLVNDTDIKCIMTHTNITPNEAQVSDFTYKFLSETYPDIDIHFCGHYHLGFEPDKLGNTTFINPWNMTRVIRDYNTKMELHTPEVTIVDFSKYSKDALPMDFVEVHELPCKPFSESFREEVISLLEENDNGFKFFEDGVVDLDELLEKQELTDTEIISILIKQQMTGKTEHEKKDILNTAIKYLGTDEEEK